MDGAVSVLLPRLEVAAVAVSSADGRRHFIATIAMLAILNMDREGISTNALFNLLCTMLP